MILNLIVEGHGDEKSLPCLAVKTGEIVGDHVVISKVIQSKGLYRLIRPGELERFVKLADTPGVEAIVIVLDLDDGCPVTVREQFEERINALGDTVTAEVRICFCVREYECWFLENIDHLRESAPEYEWIEDFQCNDPSAKRDAKGLINSAMSRHYREIVDQLKLTRRLNLPMLYQQSRSYRRFVKAITGCEYDLIEGVIFENG